MSEASWTLEPWKSDSEQTFQGFQFRRVRTPESIQHRWENFSYLFEIHDFVEELNNVLEFMRFI